MASSIYPLPPFTDEGGATVPIDSSSQAILFSLLGADVAARGTLTTRFSLHPDPATGGFFVSQGRTRLGRLPKTMRDAYPQIDHILRAGATPEVTARVRLSASTGTIDGELVLPAPGYIVPENRPPAAPWALLRDGHRFPLDLTTGEQPHLASAKLRAQFLGSLTVIDSVVVVSVNDRVLGSLSKDDSARIADLVAHYAALGVVPIARIFVHEGTAVLSSIATDEATDDDLEPQLSPLVPLDPYDPATGEFPIVSDSASQAWAVTIGGQEVADPLEYEPGRKLRPVTSPVMLAMNPDGTTVLGQRAREQAAAEAAAEAEASKATEAPEDDADDSRASNPWWAIGVVLGAIAAALGCFSLFGLTEDFLVSTTSGVLLVVVGVVVALFSLYLMLRLRR